MTIVTRVGNAFARREGASRPSTRHGRRISFKGPVLIIFALLLAGFFGLACALLPWQYVLGAFGLPVILLVGSALPLAAFVIVMLLAFGVVPEFILSALPIGAGQVRPPEVILLYLTLLVAVKSVNANAAILVRMRPYAPLLVLLAAGLAVGFVKGRVLDHNVRALSDLRQFIGWLALPVGLWLMNSRPVAFQRALISVALFASVLMLGQLLTGERLIYGFRGAETLSSEYSDITRSAIGGGLFIVAFGAYSLYIAAVDGSQFRGLSLLGCVICIGGVAASFNRAVWAGFLLGALVLVISKIRLQRSQFGVLVLLLLLILMVAIGVVITKPRVSEAVIGRVTSISEEGGRGSSLGFRFDENAQAFEKLQSTPWVGVGLGGEYKRVFRQTTVGGGFDIETSFIHNGYLSLWLKLGIFGGAHTGCANFLRGPRLLDATESWKAGGQCQ